MRSVEFSRANASQVAKSLVDAGVTRCKLSADKAVFAFPAIGAKGSLVVGVVLFAAILCIRGPAHHSGKPTNLVGFRTFATQITRIRAHTWLSIVALFSVGIALTEFQFTGNAYVAIGAATLLDQLSALDKFRKFVVFVRYKLTSTAILARQVTGLSLRHY